MNTILSISLACLLVFCILSIMSHSLLKSAIFLALASAMLGVLMYMMGAVWAAVIEVSACSGLVTVIFISAISLSNIKKDDIHKQYEDKKRMRWFPITMIVGGILLIVIALAKDFTLTSALQQTTDHFKEVFWNTRQVDIMGQIVTILIGGIAVFVLFREEQENK